MTGFQLTVSASPFSRERRPAGPPSRRISSGVRSWRCRTSAPEQKARPAPDRIATCSSGSEERRVGKEGRSRWSPEHEKKKTSELAAALDTGGREHGVRAGHGPGAPH